MMKKKQCNQVLPYRILSALERGPMTAIDLGKLLHRSDTQVRLTIKELIDQNLIHHAGYARTGKAGTFPKTYALGPQVEPPAKRPKPKTPAQKCADWRKRGGDGKRAEKIRRQMAKMPTLMSMAGMLGVAKC